MLFLSTPCRLGRLIWSTRVVLFPCASCTEMTAHLRETARQRSACLREAGGRTGRMQTCATARQRSACLHVHPLRARVLPFTDKVLRF